LSGTYAKGSVRPKAAILFLQKPASDAPDRCIWIDASAVHACAQISRRRALSRLGELIESKGFL
ncbi:MAG TPA: hypothetical protein VJ790_02895, partial [Dongiaceae bacterium]|nr:hypothetical protein [Dongiaceae bacterium]